MTIQSGASDSLASLQQMVQTVIIGQQEDHSSLAVLISRPACACGGKGGNQECVCAASVAVMHESIQKLFNSTAVTHTQHLQSECKLLLAAIQSTSLKGPGGSVICE